MAHCEYLGAFGEGRLLPILYCDDCDATENVSPRICDYTKRLSYECERCADREPGDSYYEDHGTVLHELQYPSGEWRR